MRASKPNLGACLNSIWSAERGTGGLRSPKLGDAASSSAPWYRYYAGYADGFVADVVAALPEPAGVVLDPWNGSGTTTSVAASQGIDAHGFDLNPAAVVIAKARLLRSDVAASIMPLARDLLTEIGDAAVDDADLLARWLTPRAVKAVRRLGSSIHTALVGTEPVDPRGDWCGAMSSFAALFYLGYFKVIRRTLQPFIGSNPTWLRQRVNLHDRIDIDLRTLRPCFVQAMSDLASGVTEGGLPSTAASVDVAIGNSSQLPIDDRSINAVITSPPYCTRIDYVIATLPELAALRVSTAACRQLRDGMMGTPTMTSSTADSKQSFGDTASQFLHAVGSHRSRASATYYARFFEQYFSGMRRSLTEIDRVVTLGSPIVLVAQDSYYKEVRANLPGVITDMAGGLGWSLQASYDFEVKTKANINQHTRRYHEPCPATEAVLVFSR